MPVDGVNYGRRSVRRSSTVGKWRETREPGVPEIEIG